MEKSFGARLAAARKATGLNQTQVAQFVTDAGFPVHTQAVSKWEKDVTLPSARQLVELCRLYGIRDVVETFGNSWADETVGRERILPLYRLAVSAGTGEFLDSDDYDAVTVGEEVSPQADFGVRIAGDSMEPLFVDGQIVWVRRQSSIKSGEIGIFLFNGSGYCKRFMRTRSGVRLVSLNTRYAPIKVEEGDELRLFGKVVG